MEELQLSLTDSAIWTNNEKVKQINKDIVQLKNTIDSIDQIEKILRESSELADLADPTNDISIFQQLNDDLTKAESMLHHLTFKTMFSDSMDPNNAYVDINSGSGGTEAQDWAEMLLCMYLKWCEKRGFSVEMIECSAGEVAGIKSATFKVTGEYAYGWLKSETGVHRLVRKSPFDSGNRRHTSFAAVFVSPEIDDSVEIDISPSDLRIDTYRASGAGGQHVNRTDSAVRITHIPTNTVVQCQSDRSQHKNKSQAMKLLKAKLYELEMQKRMEKQQALEQSKSDIGWGHQIRSYVLDQSRIKDLRTSVEIGNVNAVLNGDLDEFMEAYLKQNSQNRKSTP